MATLCEYLEVVLVAGAWYECLLSKERTEGGGREESPGIVARGAGLQVVPGEGGEGVAAALRHEGREGGDEWISWYSVRSDIHDGDL